MNGYNPALQPTANPLRGLSAAELCRLTMMKVHGGQYACCQ